MKSVRTIPEQTQGFKHGRAVCRALGAARRGSPPQTAKGSTLAWGRPMKIRNRLNPSDPCFSFEFFPPKTEEGLKNLLGTLEELAPLSPGFVSVTYGAGGSTRTQTVDLVKAIRARGIEAMAHVTCV